jgi:hypothetical protein
MLHPENSNEINSLIGYVESSEVVPVWCHGCQMERTMNAVYAPYVRDVGLQSCRFCRDADGMLS